MEISDILKSFSTSDIGDFRSFNEGNNTYSEQRVGENDLHALIRAWVNERAITELLPWPQDELITRCRRRVKDQTDLIESMTGDMDPKTNFSLIIIQTDVERWKFIIRSYLRARLSKIQKFTLHYLSSPALQAYLSEEESAYAIKYQQIIHQHYLNSFLSRFPMNLQNLNDSAGGINMVEVPDQEVSVFVRGLGSCNGDDIVQVKGKGKNGHGEIAVARGEVVVTKWSDVREFLKTGEMELV
ncbi:DNA replication complex GINS protein SLD5 [Golovinomyces cichoracearum]|uniref:DNA replication complex GINS protein SLD5 n=1 Tax=Golovinomyces cichoracearum TaxID=62708 RepID=A0A420IYC1_9PEZI|nr:DNA replication complex GINS protein SLD5 [Golovinomyces cichoracearum]